MKVLADHLNPRKELQAISHVLLNLHRSLVASEEVAYEKRHGKIAGPGALLQLLLTDPAFAWLRPMSTLIATLDETLDDKSAIIDLAMLADVRDTLNRWISDLGDGNEFAAHYLKILQINPDVVIAHAALRARLDALTRRSTLDS